MKKIVFLLMCVLFLTQSQAQESVSKTSIEKHLLAITKTEKPRNYKNIKVLNLIADYIKNELKKVCDSVTFQNFSVGKNQFKNVIGSIGLEHQERIIIGAHYDVYGNSDGADDNASGVAGLLELARLLSSEKLKYRIDFVAYTLEEPPFFRTENMGSYVHAKYLLDHKIPVKGMISLETIGFYSEKENSQEFPIKGMERIYGNKGNFITVVQNDKKEKFSNEVSSSMIQQKRINTKIFEGSSQLSGVDFSDHLNYWKFGYEALMITNTAFYRNKNYHTKNDTLETLDIEKIALVIAQLQYTIKQLK